MGRVVLAFVLAPLLVSLLFGPIGFAVLPIAWIMTVVVALPLFLLFKKLGWLRWWHAALAGLLSGVIFSVLFNADNPARLDAFGIDDALNFGGVGTLIALVFWWLGLYRNAALPAVPPSLPYTMLVLIPLVIGGVWLHRSFNPTFVDGRIVGVKGEPPSREITVRLSNGVVVETQFHDSWPSAQLMNQCWHLMNHWSTWRFERVYSLESPFGGGVNAC